MAKKLAIFLIVITFSFSLAMIPAVRAEGPSETGRPNLTSAFSSTLNTAAQKAGYMTVGGPSLDTMVIKIITAVLSLLGVIFTSLIIYSGIRWMTAGGNDQTLEKAKETIRQAIMCLLLVIGAYAISLFIFKIF